MARGVGFKKDLRLSKKNNYSNYKDFNFKSFIGINGDCYDRYLIRMLEMGESLNIANSTINYFVNNKINSNIIYQELINKEVKNYKKNYVYMEDLIEHFVQ
jgi:NADH-quinone oxidoreductase subunit D